MATLCLKRNLPNALRSLVCTYDACMHEAIFMIVSDKIKEKGGKVLVHCQGGINRSPSVGIGEHCYYSLLYYSCANQTFSTWVSDEVRRLDF